MVFTLMGNPEGMSLPEEEVGPVESDWLVLVCEIPQWTSPGSR